VLKGDNVIDWIRGWWITWRLRRTDRETYDWLANYQHDPDDFVDAPRPE